MVRYVRDEELIADALKQTRRGVRDVQRPTGTERAQTMQTVTEMVPVVADALEKAQQAINDAADAVTTSNGKNARRRGMTEPDPPEGGWVAGDQWVVDNAAGDPVEVRVWDGTEFVHEQLLAAELLILSGGVIRLADGTVTADALVADAVDGMTITGALIRTAPTGQRMQFDINGMRAFDASGAVTSTLFSGVGGMQVTGQFGVRDAGGTRENRLTYGDLTLTGDSHTAKVDLGGLAVIRNVAPGVFTEHRFDRYGFFHHWTDGVDTAQAELRLLNTTQGSVKTYRSELRVDWAAFPELQTNRISPLSGVDELVLDAPKVTFTGAGPGKRLGYYKQPTGSVTAGTMFLRLTVTGLTPGELVKVETSSLPLFGTAGAVTVSSLQYNASSTPVTISSTVINQARSAPLPAGSSVMGTSPLGEFITVPASGAISVGVSSTGNMYGADQPWIAILAC